MLTSHLRPICCGSCSSKGCAATADVKTRAHAYYTLGVLFVVLAFSVTDRSYGWRATMLTIGLPGLGVAMLVRLTVREPERGASERR